MLTVITACYNGLSSAGAEAIRRCVTSVARLPFPHEHLIMDGASTDGSVEFIRGLDAPALQVVSEADSGIYDALNKGIARAQGDYVYVLGLDDRIEHPEAMARVFKIAEEGRYDIVLSPVKFANGAIYPAKAAAVYEFYYHMAANHQGCLVKTGLLKRQGGYDTSYAICADYRQMLMAILQGCSVKYVPEQYAEFGMSGVSQSRTATMFAEETRIRKSIYAKGDAYLLGEGIIPVMAALRMRFKGKSGFVRRMGGVACRRWLCSKLKTDTHKIFVLFGRPLLKLRRHILKPILQTRPSPAVAKDTAPDGISVVICCYNSAWVIARCLEALKRQELSPALAWEVILVDNNCSDGTAEIARQCMRDSGIDFRIVEEPAPGLANARATGVANAKYRYLVFCDDDNLLCPRYLAKVYAIFGQDPGIGAIGGKGVPEFEREPDPRIIPYLSGYAVGSQTGQQGWLKGAGLALRTAVIGDIYRNQERYLVGRKGDAVLSGDDEEISYSVAIRGYRNYATDDISYTHVLKASRLTWEYCERMYAGFAKSEGPLAIMKLVLNGGKFGDYLRKNYIRKRLKLVRYTICFWRKGAPQVRKDCRADIAVVDCWGVLALYRIYREWRRMRKRYSANTTQ